MKEVEAKLDQIDKQIDDLKAKARVATGNAKLELQQRIHELERKARQARDKMKELQTATGQAWEELKAGMDSALDELKESYERALTYFK